MPKRCFGRAPPGLAHQLNPPPSCACTSDVELPSSARIVSAGPLCRTPLARIRSALPLPLPRTGEPNRQSEQQPPRLVDGEPHAGRAAVFGADQMAALDAERVEKAPDVGGELAGAPAVAGRLRRCAEARQIRADDAVVAARDAAPSRSRRARTRNCRAPSPRSRAPSTARRTSGPRRPSTTPGLISTLPITAPPIRPGALCHCFVAAGTAHSASTINARPHEN